MKPGVFFKQWLRVSNSNFILERPMQIKKTTATAILSILTVALAIPSCSDKKESSQTGSAEGQNDQCTYSYDPSTTEMKWTAFKFTDKVGVGGTFDSIKVTNDSQPSSVTGFLESTTIQIETKSVNSSNEERDARIRKFFFDKMSGGGKTIQIQIKRASENKGVMVIDMNGIRKEVDFNYKIMKSNEVELWTSIDTNQWKAQKSLEALNKECYDLHTGEDGISKLWSEVEIRAFTRLKEKC